MLIPPPNWGLVERGLSRSGLPSTLNLAFLAKQRIRTIVYMAAEDEEVHREQIEPALLDFLTDHNVELIQLGGAPVESDPDSDGLHAKESRDSKPAHMGSWKPTSEELVLSALSHTLDPRLFPLHLMCSSAGRHLTGVVVGCFRKLQRWSLSSIFAEYRRYAGGAGGTRGAEDWGNQLARNEQFIELFDVELLASTIGQRGLAKHMRQLNIRVTPSAAEAAAAAAAAANSNAATAAASSSTATAASREGGEGGRQRAQSVASAASRAATPAAASFTTQQQQQQQQQQQLVPPLVSGGTVSSSAATPLATPAAPTGTLPSPAAASLTPHQPPLSRPSSSATAASPAAPSPLGSSTVGSAASATPSVTLLPPSAHPYPPPRPTAQSEAAQQRAAPTAQTSATGTIAQPATGTTAAAPASTSLQPRQT